MGEKTTSTVTETKPTSGENVVNVWALSPEEQNEYNLRARGHGELADYYQQNREIREERAHDRGDSQAAQKWAEQGAWAKAETTVESPKRKGVMRRLGDRVSGMFVRKPAGK